ncbi:hypothetical protein CO666_08985 [Rhizobium chutanense]|uniref:Uncharacterized protein n=1 Tax=Rhizobium chutanense TaxID=2035448 RepID=A0A2A6JEY6_9HYPH|nr:hypothetical protein CO666_08985 [Rhizobium chutanense]
MPQLLVGAVWMLGSRPSMTEDGVAEEAHRGADTRLRNEVRPHQIANVQPSSTTQRAGRQR